MRRDNPNADTQNQNQPMFLTWADEEGKKLALMNAATAKDYGAIGSKENAQASDIFMNAANNVSVRDGMSRRDWDYFRPEESISKTFRKMLNSCNMAYKRIGIIHQVIDLMAEFTCQGIKLIHQSPRIEDLYQEWAKKIGLYERSERFCNYLYRSANVIVQRETAILRESDLNNLRAGIAADHVVDRIDPPPKIRKGEVPWYYDFINPLALDVLGGEELSQFTGVALYGLTIPEKVYNKIRTPKTEEEKYVISQLPDYVVNAARNGIKTIPLDPDRVLSFFYKKDDWELWAQPLIYSILDDLILFNKMRLADLSALDGAISHIRLWTLGDLKEHIVPTPAAMARLAEILVNNTAVGAIDLIWGPELKFTETSTDVHQFLGSEKYTQVLSNIYDAMGVPSSLRSSGKGRGGMSSYLSLRVLIERLKYGRSILNSFWESEIVRFQRAVGLRFPAKIQYDYMNLSDENAFYRLLIELADRELISDETLREAFGNNPDIESIRVRRENQQRKSGKTQPKAGPFHNPHVDDDLMKIFAQTGIITPSESGIELYEKDNTQKTLLEHEAALNPQTDTKVKGKPGQGRPQGSKDKIIRKKRTLKPTKAAAFFNTRAWAREIQGAIAEVVNPLYVASCNKKNVRSLTDIETKNLEDLRFAILCNLEPDSKFDEDKCVSMIDAQLPVDPIVYELLSTTLAKFQEKFNRVPTIDETRLFQSEVYSLWKTSHAGATTFYDEEDLDGFNSD